MVEAGALGEGTGPGLVLGTGAENGAGNGDGVEIRLRIGARVEAGMAILVETPLDT